MNARKIAVSMLSLLPDSLTRNGLLEEVSYLASLGIGVELAPTIRLDCETLISLPPEWVFAYEGPWSPPTSSVNAICNSLRGDKYALPSHLLFGSKAKEKVALFKKYFPQAIGIGVESTGVIEIKHSHGMDTEAYLAHSGGVCVDLGLIRKKPRVTEKIVRFLQNLARSDRVRAVYVRTRSRKEFRSLIYGEPTILDTYFEALRPMPYRTPIILRVPKRYLGIHPRSLQMFKEQIERLALEGNES